MSDSNSEKNGTEGRSRGRILFDLFWAFLKIGAFTFGGGYAMIALIEKEVVYNRHWVEHDHFLELLVLAQSAPGPISLNTAVFVGYKTEGYAGAVCAILGVVIPSFVIILLVAIYFHGFKDNRYVSAAFDGMRPAVVALIAAPIFNLAKGMGWWKIALAVLAAAAVWQLGVSPMYFILVGAVVGVLYAFHTRAKDIDRINDRKGGGK